MANIKISQLPSASVITGDDILPVVENTATETQQAQFSQVLSYITSSTFDSLNVTTVTSSDLSASSAQIGYLDVDTINARVYNSEVVNAVELYEFGSTKFGNTVDDVHQFTGSIRQEVGADNYFFGKIGVGTSNPSYDLSVTGTFGVSSTSELNVLSASLISSSLVPFANEVFDLGSPTNRWRDLYISSSTIYFGLNSLTVQDGNLLFGLSPIVTSSGATTSLEIIEASIITSSVSITGSTAQFTSITASTISSSQIIVDIPLDYLIDVSASSATNGQVLSYNSVSAQWEPTTIAGSGDVLSTGDNVFSGINTFNVNYITASVGITGSVAKFATVSASIISASSYVGPVVTTNANNTFTGTNTFQSTFNQFTGSFKGNVDGTATTATNAVNVAVTDDTSTNAVHYVTFVGSNSSNQAINVDSSTLTYNPSTNTLTVANLDGNASTATTAASATNATTATNAVNVAVTDDTSTNAVHYVTFVGSNSSNQAINVDSSTLTYNPSTNTLTVANLVGNASTANSVTNTLTRGAYLTGLDYNGSAATTWTVDASSANIGGRVVARDSNGNFSANQITASAGITGSVAEFTTISASVISASTYVGVPAGDVTSAGNNTFTGINTFNTNYITASAGITGSVAEFTTISASAGITGSVAEFTTISASVISASLFVGPGIGGVGGGGTGVYTTGSYVPQDGPTPGSAYYAPASPNDLYRIGSGAGDVYWNIFDVPAGLYRVEFKIHVYCQDSFLSFRWNSTSTCATYNVVTQVIKMGAEGSPPGTFKYNNLFATVPDGIVFYTVDGFLPDATTHSYTYTANLRFSATSNFSWIMSDNGSRFQDISIEFASLMLIPYNTN